MEKPAPQPITGADEMPKRVPRPMTYDELAELKARMGLNTQPAMPERSPAPPPVHAPPAPPPMPIQNMDVAAATSPATAAQSGMPEHSSLNAAPPIVATARIETAEASPPAPQKQYRFTQGLAIDPETEMRRLLQSNGAPSDPQTVAHVLFHENPMEAYRAIVRRARSPA